MTSYERKTEGMLHIFKLGIFSSDLLFNTEGRC